MTDSKPVEQRQRSASVDLEAAVAIIDAAQPGDRIDAGNARLLAAIRHRRAQLAPGDELAAHLDDLEARLSPPR